MIPPTKTIIKIDEIYKEHLYQLQEVFNKYYDKEKILGINITKLPDEYRAIVTYWEYEPTF